MAFLGLRMEHFLLSEPGIAPTPEQIQLLATVIREKGIPAIIQSSYYSSPAVESLVKSTEVHALTLCQDDELSSYSIDECLGRLKCRGRGCL